MLLKTKEFYNAKLEGIKNYLHFKLYLKVDREGASLTSCYNSFQNLAPRNENVFWPLLVFIRGTSKSVSRFLKFTISRVEFLVNNVER